MPRSRRSRPPKRPSRAARHARATGAYRRAAVNRAEGLIEIRLPQRRREPATVVAHLGPTNSGKTHDALEFLAEQGRGVYAGPLRMLAQEAHRRLGAVVGTERVGLITGEERINENAPILCCTVEMAPDRGEVLVLDEVQWADDEERGAAWTGLLLAGEYQHIRLLGALDALPLVRARSRRPSSACTSGSCRSSGSARTAPWATPGRCSSPSAARRCSHSPVR